MIDNKVNMLTVVGEVERPPTAKEKRSIGFVFANVDMKNKNHKGLKFKRV
jgi:hypothetical protein